MKIVVFGEQQRVGALAGELVVDLNRAFARDHSEELAESRVPAHLEAFIAAGEQALDEARRAIESASSSGPDGRVVHRAADVKIHAPWPGRRIACAGGNFADHLLGMETNRGGSRTLAEIIAGAREAGQWGFWKVPDTVAGLDDGIPFPKRTRYFDYEGEAAIVIGKRGKDISASKLDDYVWGITVANDWSIRDSSPRTRPMSYNQNKNFDGSITLGPCIAVGELKPSDVDVETRVNDEPRQRYNTRDMIFSFGEILELLSRDFTFVPGDVILGGTAAGTAADKTKPLADGTRPLDLFLKIGDVVEVSSPKIGAIRNRIIGG